MAPSSRRSMVTAGSQNEIGRSRVSLRACGMDMLDCALMSAWLHLCGLAIEERAEPKFSFLVALRHRRHQRFHQEAGLRIGLGDQRQRLQYGEIGQRRIARDLCGKFHRLVEGSTLL